MAGVICSIAMKAILQELMGIAIAQTTIIAKEVTENRKRHLKNG